MPVILALGMLKQEHCHMFRASLDHTDQSQSQYRVKTLSKKKQKQKGEEISGFSWLQKLMKGSQHIW